MYPAHLTPYCGLNLPIQDEFTKLGYEESCKRSLYTYAEHTPDGAFKREQIWLNSHTANYIYTNMTRTLQPWPTGQSPFLEQIAKDQTAGASTDRERLFRLLAFVRDLSKQPGVPQQEPFHGGTEEDVVRKGSNMCNEMARVLIRLCQIMGMAARYIGHTGHFDSDGNYQPGHGVTEIFLEEAWAYMDIRGVFFIKPDNTFANTWELLCDPGLIDNQPDWVTEQVDTRYTKTSSQRYFSGASIPVVNNYYPETADNYLYDWVWCTPAFNQQAETYIRQLHQRYLDAIHTIGKN